MISVITVTHNSVRCLERLRESLKGSTSMPYEWIVVDNGSSRAETQTLLDHLERDGEAVVIRHDRNLWFTKGVNAGIAKAGGDPIVLLNPDCSVSRGWLESMVAALRVGRGRVGIVGAVLINERAQVVHAGAYAMGIHEGYLEHYDDRAPWAKTRELKNGWVTGACLMISRQALEAGGGQLDEAYAHFHSDRVLCERVRNAGFEIWMSSHVLVHSVGGCQL